jgi:hypothetical protein
MTDRTSPKKKMGWSVSKHFPVASLVVRYYWRRTKQGIVSAVVALFS